MTANYLLIIVSLICRWKYHCPDRQRNGYSEEKESWNIYIYLYKKTRRSGASLQCTGTLFLSKNYHNSCNYWHCVIPKCRVPPKQLIVKSSTKVEDLRLFCIIMNINANPGRKEENWANTSYVVLREVISRLWNLGHTQNYISIMIILTMNNFI